MFSRLCLIVFFLSAAICCAENVLAQTADEFYGTRKDITIVVGSAPGGGYDIYARAAGRFMTKYLPGNPNYIINNMPGGGGMRAANYLYNVAPKDGSTIMIFSRGLTTAPLLYGDESKAQYEALKFGWIGSLVKEMGMGAVSNSSPARTIEEMKKHEIVLGASGVENDGAMYVRMFNYLYGTKFKLIAGYQGQQEVLGAVEKGELHGLFLSGWSGSGRAAVREQISRGAWSLFVQLGLEKDPDFPNVPTVMEITTDPQDKAALEFLFGRQVLGEPFAAPPGIPADRLQKLRSAFRQACLESTMGSELEQQRFAFSPVFGEEAQDIIKKLYETPEPILNRARVLVGAKTN